MKHHPNIIFATLLFFTLQTLVVNCNISTQLSGMQIKSVRNQKYMYFTTHSIENKINVTYN